MTAPSFSSFPPSFASFPDIDPGPSKRSSGPSEQFDDKKRKVTGKDKHKKRRSDKDRHKSPTEHYLADDEKLKAREDAKRVESEQSQRLFYSDRKGDALNVQYGGLHAGDVPKYHIYGRGRNILGLPSALVVVYRSGKGIEVGLGGRRKVPGLTDSSTRSLLAAAPTRRVLQSGDNHKYEEIDGFLRLPGRRGRNGDEQSYRSITLSKDNANSDSDSSSESEHGDGSDTNDDDSDTTTNLTSHQATLKSLEQQLTADPSSISGWLLLLSQTLSTIPITSKNATKARSEITLSILGRALSVDLRNRTSKTLRLKYLKAGEEVWHESKLRSEWEDALKVGGVGIWMEWLEWRIRSTNKGIDGVVEDATRVLGALSFDDEGEIGKVRVFWRTAVAIQNAGFVERGTAMFQAQAELTFEMPQALCGLPLQKQLNELEDFWESEVPRIGEEGAKGWTAWTTSSDREHVPIPSTSAPQSKDITDLDPYRQWAFQESFSDRLFHLPTRSTSESDDLDPYATILFSDVRPLLLSLQSTPAKNAFRLAWLSYIGLYLPGFTSSLSSSHQENNWDDRWSLGYLTRPAYLNAIFPKDATSRRMTTDAVAGALVGREKEYASGFGPVRCWGYGVIGPLDVGINGESAGKGKSRGGMWRTEDVEDLDGDFVRRVFGQLRLGADDVEWDILALTFEAAVSVKSALKLSRSFLSNARGSLLHWAAHAQLERIRGRHDEARKVYQAVLIASTPATMQVAVGQMWWNWAEMEWVTGRSGEALNVVLRAAGVEGRGSVVTLRAKRNLEDAIKGVEGQMRWKDQEAWIKLRALLELLMGNDPSAALVVFDSHLAHGRLGQVTHESLTVACLLMLYHYAVVLKNPMPPSLLRKRANKAMDEYPSNSVILGLFLEGEKGQGVWGRVRGILGESGGKTKDVARRIEEVWIAGWERGRWEGEVERTRSGLAAAVEHERTRASCTVWRVFIELEIRAGQLQRAKKMLFRAIGECPLSKELYLMAFGALRGVFSRQELDGFWDTMAERGIRMRKGVDEVVGGWMWDKDEGEGMEDNDEDEIEENARELRRLMPY